MDVRLLDEATANRLPKVVLMLAARAPHYVSRDELLEALWPEVRPDVGRNRLRVALSRLRYQFALDERGDGVRMDPARVTLDVLSLLRDLESLRHEPDPDQEWETRVELLPTLRKRLLPRRNEFWLRDLQDRWAFAVSDAVAVLIDLAEARRDVGVAIAAAEAGLLHFPHDPGYWTTKLRALRRLGPDQSNQVKQGLRDFGLAREQLQASGADFDGDLLRLARSVGETSKVGEDPYFTPGEAELMLRAFHRAMETEPGVVAALLGSASFRPEMLRSPHDGLRLLKDVAQHPLSETEEHARIPVRIVTCLALLQRDHEVIAESERVLEREQHPHRRRIVLLNRSWALLQVGRFDEAFEAVEEAIRLAEATDYELDAWQCRAQRAAFLLLTGKVDEALPILQDAVSYLRLHDRSVDRDTLVIEANLGLAHLLLGQTDEAAQVLRSVRKAAKDNGVADAQGLSEPILGFILAQEGVSSEAKECLMSGLRFAYRFGPREATVALGFAVAALHGWGHPTSKHLARDWHALALSAHVRLSAPQEWIAEQIGLTDKPRGPTPDLLVTVRAVVRAVREHAVMP